VGAVDVSTKKCEGCGLKWASQGLSSDGKKRWCGGCAKKHVGAVDASTKKCEGCGLKAPSFELPSGRNKRRWRSVCEKEHVGAMKNR
jgi:hypothetical protein